MRILDKDRRVKGRGNATRAMISSPTWVRSHASMGETLPRAAVALLKNQRNMRTSVSKRKQKRKQANPWREPNKERKKITIMQIRAEHVNAIPKWRPGRFCNSSEITHFSHFHLMWICPRDSVTTNWKYEITRFASGEKHENVKWNTVRGPIHAHNA